MIFLNDLLEFRFLQHAVLAALLCSVICGIMGSFVVIRRSTYAVGAISHCALGGIGFSRYLQVVHGIEWMTPMLGALLAALLAGGIASAVRARATEREDTLLSAMWALGMALGITFMTLTPGYAQDLMGYLFGDILLVSTGDLWIMAGLTLLILGYIAWSYDRLVAVSFNTTLAELRGTHSARMDVLFTLATALTVVVLVRLVGIVLVIALLTLPAATASRLSTSLPRMMLLAVGISASTLVLGLWISYAWNLPAGATMIELAALVYVAALLKRR
ncbi:MAG: metal ABC transporter permease [Puniceicoccaceae bacterium]